MPVTERLAPDKVAFAETKRVDPVTFKPAEEILVFVELITVLEPEIFTLAVNVAFDVT